METLFKPSFYNFYIPIPEKNIGLLYNTLYGGLTELNSTECAFVSNNVLESGTIDPGRFTAQDIEIFQNLVKGKFVVENSVEEYPLYLEKYHQWHRDLDEKSGQIVVTMTMTLACNLACRYCFQNGAESGIMKPETFDQFLGFVEQRMIDNLKKRELTEKRFGITWFGGEPLLTLGYLPQYTEKLRELCDRYEYSYYASMVSNGTLLTPENWNIIEKCGIEQIQITLDGPAHLHDHRRLSKTPGESSYEKIIRNLKSVPESIHLTIRVNTDKYVWENIGVMLDDLEANGIWPQKAKNMNIALAFIQSYDNSRHTDSDWYFTYEEYQDIEVEFIDIKLKRYNAWAKKNGQKPARKKFDMPTISFSECLSAVYKNGFVIDPEGYLHKCWELVDKKDDRLGHVSQPYDPHATGFADWHSYQKTKNSFCDNCKYLPVCDVHCTVKMTRDLRNRQCFKWRGMIEKRLKHQYVERMENPELYQSL